MPRCNDGREGTQSAVARAGRPGEREGRRARGAAGADNLQSLSARDIRRLVDEHEMEVVIDLRTDMEVRFEGPGPLAAEPGVRVELRSLTPTRVRSPASTPSR